jgi:hypothetical protein
MRGSRQGRDRARLAGMLAAGLPLGGCANAPSVSVLGAYFPDWLFCIVAGVLLTIVVYAVLKRTRYSESLGLPMLVYPALATLLSLLVWLIFFQH